MMTVGCPVCGGAIRCTTESFPGGLNIIIDRVSAAWHVANCYGGPPPGDRDEDRGPFVAIVPSARGFGRRLGEAA